MAVQKTDRPKCELGYFRKWNAMHTGEITADEFKQWYDEHCGSCRYMNEICMFDEATNGELPDA